MYRRSVPTFVAGDTVEYDDGRPDSGDGRAVLDPAARTAPSTPAVSLGHYHFI